MFTELRICSDQTQISGIYPHLAMFNDEGECGTGAVVPWSGRLWVITHGPHLPFGSSDKLHEINHSLEQIIRPESVGGTPAITNDCHYGIMPARRFRSSSKQTSSEREHG